MNAEELDRKFDDDEEDILDYFDLSTLQRPGLEPQPIAISLPEWMVAVLDREAQLHAATALDQIKEHRQHVEAGSLSIGGTCDRDRSKNSLKRK